MKICRSFSHEVALLLDFEILRIFSQKFTALVACKPLSEASEIRNNFFHEVARLWIFEKFCTFALTMICTGSLLFTIWGERICRSFFHDVHTFELLQFTIDASKRQRENYLMRFVYVQLRYHKKMNEKHYYTTYLCFFAIIALNGKYGVTETIANFHVPTYNSVLSGQQ